MISYKSELLIFLFTLWMFGDNKIVNKRVINIKYTMNKKGRKQKQTKKIIYSELLKIFNI